MGVFYDSKVLAIEESGNFWLSDTPDVPGGISWGNLYPRMVTWALFRRLDDGRRFYFLNTHLPYRDEDEPRRVKVPSSSASACRPCRTTCRWC